MQAFTKTPKILLALCVFGALAGCVDDGPVGPMEADMSQANINTDCPVDVSEADRANYPACQ